MANSPDVLGDPAPSESVNFSLYQEAIESMLDKLESGELTRVEATIIVSKKDLKGEEHNLQDLARYFFEEDPDWWRIKKDKSIIHDVKFLDTAGNVVQKFRMRTGAHFIQHLQMPFFGFTPSKGKIDHLVKVVEVTPNTYRTVAVPIQGTDGMQLSYVADFRIEETADSYKLTLVGHLETPLTKAPNWLKVMVTQPINLATKIALKFLLASRIRTGDYRKSLKKTGEQ